MHDEHKANVAEEPAYFSCALFDLLSVFVRAKLIQSLLMIPSQLPVNIDVSENEQAVYDYTLDYKEAKIKEILELVLIIIIGGGPFGQEEKSCKHERVYGENQCELS